MAIVDMKLGWLKSGVRWGRFYEGLLISAKREDIFSDPPRIEFSHIKTLSAHEEYDKHVSKLVLVGPSFHKQFRLPSPNEKIPMKFVGDPQRGTSRRVYEYIGKDSGLDFRLGLTIHEARGTWSSEPHDFELEAMKSLKPMRFWERFAYITDPAHQWGIQTRQGFLNGEFMRDIQIVKDGDILDIPLGVHMVTAGPGVKLAYIWVYQAEDISAAEKF